MTIALSDARGLRTLLLITRGDYQLAWDLAQTFATYEELASAPRSFLAARFGAAGVRLHLLPVPPSPPPLLSGIWVITRLDHRYPRGIVEALGEAAPPVLYGAGSLSAIRDPVAIGGPLYADGAGVARARALASRITTAAEPVKLVETPSYDAFCSGSSFCSSGSLIQATLGSSGGAGRRWRKRAGLAA